MIAINWTWTLLLVGSSTFALMSYFRIDCTKELFLNFLAQVIVYGLGLWVVCRVINRILNAFRGSSDQLQTTDEDVEDEWEERMRLKQQRIRQSMQAKYDKKAEDFKKRILEPRNEQRRQKQEQELNLIRGHIFQGQGHESGFDDSRPRPSTSTDDGSANSDAREKRQLPEHVRLHTPKPADSRTVNRRVIKLPPEPDLTDNNVVTIVIHTPFNQKYSRRFLTSCHLQVVFDYMTTLGYSQYSHTLAASYPRRQLTNFKDKLLTELNFGTRTVLHIEEKD